MTFNDQVFYNCSSSLSSKIQIELKSQTSGYLVRYIHMLWIDIHYNLLKCADFGVCSGLRNVILVTSRKLNPSATNWMCEITADRN